MIEAAIILLEAQGPDALSLRAVAAEAGVSHTAPYAHFKDKRTLLAAVAEVGFERLAARMQPPAGSEATHEERFLMTGRGYVAFAVEAPGLFRLMFSSALGSLDAFPGLRDKSDAAFGLFRESLAGVLKGHKPSPADLSTLRASAWSLIHGLATLIVEQRISAGPGGVAALTKSVTDLYLRQIADGR